MNSDKLLSEAKSTGSELLSSTYSTTLTSLDTAFALATALAWTEAIKALVKNVVPKGSGHVQMTYYALFVTLMYTVYMMLTKRQASKVNVLAGKIA